MSVDVKRQMAMLRSASRARNEAYADKRNERKLQEGMAEIFSNPGDNPESGVIDSSADQPSNSDSDKKFEVPKQDFRPSKKESGEYKTPVSSATMYGMYEQDDSPAAQQSFIDQYTSQNTEKQKRYAGDAMNVFNKYGKMDARAYSDESMENAIGRSTQYSYDRADRQTGLVLGDIWHDQYNTSSWNWPKAPDEIKSNAADIAKQAKEDIEDI